MIGERPDGATSANGQIRGCYLHGIFASDQFRAAFLESLGHKAGGAFSYEAVIDETLDALATHMDAHVDLDLLLEIAQRRQAEMNRKATA